MDGYPLGSLDHNVPYLLVSGLTTSNSELPLQENLKYERKILLKSKLPAAEGTDAKALARYFQAVDEQGKSWAAVGSKTPYRFRIKNVGRTIPLPPRQARLPERTETLESHHILHSPFSPLSPVSSLYPDGLIDAQWVKKHQELVPSVLLCFYTLTTDPTTTTLRDNELKNDIGELKAMLAKSGYKTRLAVALIADQDSTASSLAAGLQERLENIRRGATLDPKSLFYIPPQDSDAELRGVVDSVLTTLYGSAVEYYRDLARHSRKKRSRGIAPPPTVPPTTGTSRTLSIPDWNLRYDFKSGIFAEFRQEYDAAVRFYEQAYGTLLGQDVLDVIPSWSPRWNEARLLSDVISIRCLRVHFWMGMTSLAVKRWQVHRDNIQDFVDRRGHGTANYGWQAWEARWATVMADLIEKIQIPGLTNPSPSVFLPPDRSMMAERINPWEHLHHRGYWYRIAARHLGFRRRLAHSIPDDDRVPPEDPTVKEKFGYDTYLCPKPYEEYPLRGHGVNHSQLIIDCLIKAQTQFQSRNQTRTAAEISLECAKEMASTGSWQDVLSVLRPLWEESSFRSGGWINIAEDFAWLLRRAAVDEGEGDLVVAIDWELMHKRYTQRPNWHYDLSKSLEETTCSSKPEVRISDDQVEAPIVAGWAFMGKESRAGETCVAQLSLKSEAFSTAAPLTFKSLKIEFDGALKPIVLEHLPCEEKSEGKVSLAALTLEEVFDAESGDLPTMLKGQTDLTLSPGNTLVVEMVIALREAGEVTSSTLQLNYGAESFDLSYTMDLGDLRNPAGWYTKGYNAPRYIRAESHMLHVQPRPPKLEIKYLNSSSQYYVSEPIKLRVQLVNGEDESVSVKLDAHLFGKVVPAFALKANGEEQKVDSAEEESRLTEFPIGELASSSSLDVILTIDPAEEPTSYDLHLRASYHLDSDAATPITQMLPLQLTVVNAFESNYDLNPRLHPDAWPSLFDCDTISSSPDIVEDTPTPFRGLSQSWCLMCHFASFALHDLKIVGMELKVLSNLKNARCDIVKQAGTPKDGILVAPKTMHEARFDLVTQKVSLDDRHPVPLELGFVIQWQRHETDGEQDGDGARPINTTTMYAGNYLVLGSEPRVLASASEIDMGKATRLLLLDITIENPSNHFLTFGLNVEPSDEFAFSGAKQTTVHLLPLSRRALTYRLLPLVRGDFIRPGILVRDKYFQKTLRIIPTEGMKIDKEGLLIWITPMEGEGEEGKAAVEVEEDDDETGGSEE
ncbi:unnamed protein product [Clonostachys rosea]|uniref:Trafficking protein particle complex subunit 11 domain-containing protein n=1 Tax=Bionectria ochroleuca TaxID=29856 RepID=A0ABY6TRV3_BIOOC|nr:unnamed protein product [Clonostachys rosea]